MPELLVEIVANVLIEWLFGTFGSPRVTRGGLLSIAVLITGALLGWVSTALVTNPLIPWIAARVVYVIVVPPMIATVIDWSGRRRAANGRARGFVGNWIDAYLFALGFSVTRFFATL